MSEWFDDVFNFFNQLFSIVFFLGNYIFFAWFLFLFYSLYKGSKLKENNEKIHSYALSSSKKYGRGGMIGCVVIGVLFLTNILIMLLDSLTTSLPAPFIYKYIFSSDLDLFYAQIKEGEVEVLLIDKFFLYFLGFISLLCFFLLAYGVFLLIYNERILHTKWKPFNFIIIGLIGSIICGFTLPFTIMNGLKFKML